ncbi:hypothetical protein, partial [Paenibacillus larvae]|uniref:hypothetical protein n=1 Tax=Paenibacillus larvae TaxID=1464 RepID=UPI001A7E199A
LTVTHGVLKLHTALLKLSALWRLTVTHGVLKLEMKALCEQKELGLTVTQGVLKRLWVSLSITYFGLLLIDWTPKTERIMQLNRSYVRIDWA